MFILVHWLDRENKLFKINPGPIEHDINICSEVNYYNRIIETGAISRVTFPCTPTYLHSIQ